MDHPNIIKLFETYEDRKNIYLIMEICSGGELFDRIIDMGHFSEAQAARVMSQIFRAIFYMHENNICHRDLKPENFLFVTKEPIEVSVLKIIDFGLACEFDENTLLTTKAGTPYYVSPQVLDGSYDARADHWSCGVIMYVVLCGYPPFHGDTDNEVLKKIRSGVFGFSKSDWGNITEDAKDLIRELLKSDPAQRCTADQALNHVWVKNQAPSAELKLPTGLVENLHSFRKSTKLKKAALHVIASQLGEGQVKALRDTFLALDDNKDGLLTADEVQDGMRRSGFNVPVDLQQILEEVDSDGSGVIDYTEFLAAALDKQTYCQEDLCWAAFRVFDRDGNGKISKEEIAQVLGNGIPCAALEESGTLVEDFDTNGDGEIDFQEFMDMMRSGSKDPSSLQLVKAQMDSSRSDSNAAPVPGVVLVT